jgi:hypothetical protein
MNNGVYYNPQPPRAWSRVQSLCSITTVPNSQYLVYVPRTKQNIPPGQADLENQILIKGNILQYKKNSSNFTKNQRYSRISNIGIRGKTYATQSITYSNPNTSGLLRVNSIEIPPNTIVGQPNNESGPFQYNVRNPFGCSSTSVQSGGNLICNTVANPCTNKLIKTYKILNCSSINDSDVPGFSNPDVAKVLCWDPRINTWYPKQRLIMSNSGNKWPTNYKALVSAVTPAPPILTLDANINSSITLSWTVIQNTCIPISGFIIYQNGKVVKSVSYVDFTVLIDNLIVGQSYSFYGVSVSNTILSTASNTITVAAN